MAIYWQSSTTSITINLLKPLTIDPSMNIVYYSWELQRFCVACEWLIMDLFRIPNETTSRVRIWISSGSTSILVFMILSPARAPLPTFLRCSAPSPSNSSNTQPVLPVSSRLRSADRRHKAQSLLCLCLYTTLVSCNKNPSSRNE
jgi:hypothetical protein